MAASLEWRLTGGAGNTDPDASLGGVVSSQVVSSTALNNLFDNVNSDESVTGDVEYRAIQLQNAGNATAMGVLLWIVTETPCPDSIIAVGQDSGVQSIADESTAPDTPTITFTRPLVGTPMSIGNIAVGTGQRIWFRRTIDPLADSYNDDTIQILIRYM